MLWKLKWHMRGWPLSAKKIWRYYRDIQIGERRVDFFVEQLIMVELKAIINLEDVHFAQGTNYLEAYNMEIGLLINFGSQSLTFKRLLNRKFKPS